MCHLFSKRKKTIPFSDVENLQYGKILGTELRDRFGDPDKIEIQTQTDEVWIYEGSQESLWTDRAKFKVNKTNGVVLSVIWTPDVSESFSNMQAVLSHFKSLKFQHEKPKWRGHDTSFGTYYSPESGISFVHDDRMIWAIGISSSKDFQKVGLYKK